MVLTLGAVVLSRVTLFLDNNLDSDVSAWYLFPGSAASARSFLSTIATSTLTITGVVFSVTVLVLQLASSQLSPRVMRSFLRDTLTQVTLGAFVATFVFCLLILREIDFVGEGTGFVPAFSIWSCFTLVLLDIALFIAYINHMAHSIRPTSVLGTIASETRNAVDRMYPGGVGEDAGSLRELGTDCVVLQRRGQGGVIVDVDLRNLMQKAREGNLVVGLRFWVGDYVPDDGDLLVVWGGDNHDKLADDLVASVALSSDRSMTQDPRFGLRQMVDIAERALSPGVNDPTTAVQALDQLHSILRRLCAREFPSPLRYDDDGQLRLILPRPALEDYVSLAFDEVMEYGARSIQVYSRVMAMLEDLIERAPPEVQSALRHRLQLLHSISDHASGEGLQQAFLQEARRKWESRDLLSEALETHEAAARA